MTGKQLAKERKARGLSMRELAAKSGVSASTISNIEAGRFDPRGKTLRQLIETLKKAPKMPEL